MKIGTRTVAVVTGAASGIGRALAVELARRGASVALIDIDRAGLDAAAAVIRGESPPEGEHSDRCSTHVCSVADADAMRAASDAVIAAHGAVHVLLNNAGISVAGPIEQLPLADFQDAMAVNFWGVLHGCRAFLPHLRAAAARGDAAAVCTVLSDFALCSLPTKAAYAASKHAARALTDALAAELHGTGISVTAVYPGATATGLVARGRAVDAIKRDREASFLAGGLPPDVVARRIVSAIERRRARVLIGRDARAIDVATRLSPALFQAVVRRFWRRLPFL